MNIKLLKRSSIPPETNRFIFVLLTLFNAILLPFIFIINMTLMLVLFIYSKITITDKDKQEIEQDIITQNNYHKMWHELFNTNEITFYYKFAGSILHGPDYYNFKSEPIIKDFENELYGHWFFLYFGGIFLQKWNSINSPNCDLIFIDIKNKKAITLLQQIKSVFWIMEINEEGSLIFNFKTIKESFDYKITLDDLNNLKPIKLNNQ